MRPHDSLEVSHKPAMFRKYELILLGATGHTGKLTAEHLAQHAPTDLRWALGGRSEAKLNNLAADLKRLNPDRTQPSELLGSWAFDFKTTD